MTYRILSADNPDSLATLVNDAINEGWVPVGGVAVRLYNSSGAIRIYQAVTR